MIKREFICVLLTIFAILCCSSLIAEERIEMASGTCELQGTDDWSGTKVKFTGSGASSVIDSVFTDESGLYEIYLQEGLYTVTFSHTGFTTYEMEIELFDSLELPYVVLLIEGIEINGAVSGIWESGNIYDVIGNIFIAEEDTLIIEPGVIVYFHDYYNLTVTGKIVAAGEENNEILFTSKQLFPEEGDWEGIIMQNQMDDSSIMTNTVIEYAVNGIHIDRAEPEISNCTFRYNSERGVYIYISTFELINCFFEDNYEGIRTDYTCTPEITGNVFKNNYRGIYCASYSEPVITKNEFYDNTLGIYVSDLAGAEIIGNTMTGHHSAAASYSDEVSFTNNIFYDNHNAVVSYGDSEISLMYNNFWVNVSDYVGDFVPAGFGSNVTVNTNGDPCDPYSNIFLEPQFVSAPVADASWMVENDTLTFYFKSRDDWGEPYRFQAKTDPDAGEFYNTIMTNIDDYWTTSIDLFHFGETPIGWVKILDDDWAHFILFETDFAARPFGPPFDFGGSPEADRQLLAGSPCIDAGDPDYIDPDETIADIGAYYFDQGSEPPVIIDFTASALNGSAPLPVQFLSDVSGPVTDFLWNFGDDETSTLPNPVHVYSDPGIYSVNLTVTGPGGSDAMTKADYISVEEEPVAPIADFSADPLSGTAPVSIQFSNLSTGAYSSIFWEFGDGGSSTEENPIHEYLEAGSYSVSLTVNGDMGSDTEIKSEYIQVFAPQEVAAAFTVSEDYGCLPFSVTFNNQSVGIIDSLLWEFGTGDTSYQQNPIYTYQEEGEFIVSLTVYGPLNTSTAIDTIIVESPFPLIEAIVDRPDDQGGYVYVMFSKSFYDSVQPQYPPGRETESYTVQYLFEEVWITVAATLAMGEESYTILAETYQNYDPVTFRVIAGMEEGTWISETMSGFSLDNLAPAIPTGLILNGDLLVWDPPLDNDFNYFTIYLDGAVIDHTVEPEYLIAGLGGDIQISATDFNNNESDLSESITGFMYGDVDSNGQIEAYDASLVLQYYVGLDPLPQIDPLPWEPWRLLIADVDGNQQVEAFDASLIMQYNVGYIDQFPVENFTGRNK